jgi:hypothetical protein
MLGSIGKGNFCVVVVCMAKTNNHQNRTKYQTIVEEIRLQLTQVLYLLLFKLVSCLQNVFEPRHSSYFFHANININIWRFLVIFELLFSFIFISNYKINLHSTVVLIFYRCIDVIKIFLKWVLFFRFWINTTVTLSYF